MQIQDIFEVRTNIVGTDQVRRRILVKGREFKSTAAVFGKNTGIWRATGFTLWAYLDASYRRVIGYPWMDPDVGAVGDDGAGRSEGYCKVDASEDACWDAQKFVLYLRNHRYPSRAA